jgi:signal transduction histidine kinase
MYKPLLKGILLVMLYSPVMSQPDPDSVEKNNHRRQIDSLQKKIKNAKEDTFLVKKLCLLSDHYCPFWPDSALAPARRAIQLAEKLKYPHSIMMGLLSLANAFYLQRKFDSSTYYAQKGLDICMKNDLYYEEQHLFRYFMNNNFFFQGDYTGAMKISTDGLARAERIKDKKTMEHFSSVLGYIMMKLQNFELSRHYFSSELELAKEIKDKDREAHSLMNLADLSIAEKKLPEAIQFINDALNIYKTLPEAFLVNGSGFEKEAYIYNKFAEVYKLMQKNSDALQYSLKAIRIVRINHVGNPYDVAAYYINAGNIYNLLQKPDSAISYLRLGQVIAQKVQHTENLRDAFEQLSVSFAKLKKFDSAFIYLQSFTQLKDSILNESGKRDIANLQIERQQRIQQAELSRQQLWRNIIIVVFIVVLLIVSMLYYHFRTKQKIVYQQQLNKQQNEMFNLAASLQEKERKRIAEDLHDGLGSVLSAAKLKLSALNGDKKFLTEEQQEKYLATLSLLDEAATELRNISHNIMPATLSKLGLIAALKNITERISSHSGLMVELEIHGMDAREDKRLEESIEISIYRIILELLNNIVKHAEATKAVVQLIKYPDYINVTVEDNGKGFEYKKAVNENKGIGLGNIESRVSYLNGTIEVDSRTGKGTVTIIDIPYNSDFKIP